MSAAARRRYEECFSREAVAEKMIDALCD
jgi:hypothetical protein